jgi:hypothetical protein
MNPTVTEKPGHDQPGLSGKKSEDQPVEDGLKG